MRVPSATYRVQLHSAFGFAEARRLIPYLEAAGISDLYLSPILKARRGSTHGYDVTDPSCLNPELGLSEEFEALADELRSRGMGLLVDIVPNHMAASSENPWWTDVLENGASSPYASYFDVEWERTERALGERIWLPILGGPFGSVLEDGQFSITLEERGFILHYYSAELPLDPKTYPMILGEHPAIEDIVAALDRLPGRAAAEWDLVEARRREQPVVKRKLWEAYSNDRAVRAFVDSRLASILGTKGDPASFNELERLLNEQPYTLAYWLTAREKINYRRFFDITELIGVRAEDRQVYESTHELIFRYLKQGRITGLRVDHVDGLYNPAGYVERLKESTGSAYVVVEKILAAGESLPSSWPVHGTVGYDFLAAVNSVFVDPAGLEACTRLYEQFTGITSSFDDIVYRKKKYVMRDLFPSETAALGLHLASLAEHDRYGRDLSPSALTGALIELTACLPVYRTYISDNVAGGSDRRYIEEALEAMRRRNPGIDPLMMSFLRRVLLLEIPNALSFVRRWQQMSGPVMAKGNEDTALYVYNRLVSMNDVGSWQEPLPVAEFHRFNQERRTRWPHTMNATSTHDTKRSEDVRARINVLAELSAGWTRCLPRWSRWNDSKRRQVNGKIAPDPNEEILIYQNLLGAWPFEPEQVPEFRERLKVYFRKALREAKTNTSWLRPDEPYENACLEFIDAILCESPVNRFLKDFLKFQRRVAFYGRLNSLSQVLLKIVSPGVPDFYQGALLWDLSLVDPDNRRPVDFPRRLEIIRDVPSWNGMDLFAHWRDGVIKLYLSVKAQQFRKRNRELFDRGDYIALDVRGSRKEHAIAFARRLGQSWAIAITPRLVAKLSSTDRLPLGRITWHETAVSLPSEAPVEWTNVITGERCAAVDTPDGPVLPLREALRTFPVALLIASRQKHPDALNS